MKKNTPIWGCDECIHSTQETTDDVACCNCCEDGEFFESIDPFHENDPYVITNPMAFY